MIKSKKILFLSLFFVNVKVISMVAFKVAKPRVKIIPKVAQLSIKCSACTVKFKKLDFKCKTCSKSCCGSCIEKILNSNNSKCPYCHVKIFKKDLVKKSQVNSFRSIPENTFLNYGNINTDNSNLRLNTITNSYLDVNANDRQNPFYKIQKKSEKEDIDESLSDLDKILISCNLNQKYIVSQNIHKETHKNIQYNSNNSSKFNNYKESLALDRTQPTNANPEEFNFNYLGEKSVNKTDKSLSSKLNNFISTNSTQILATIPLASFIVFCFYKRFLKAKS